MYFVISAAGKESTIHSKTLINSLKYARLLAYWASSLRRKQTAQFTTKLNVSSNTLQNSTNITNKRPYKRPLYEFSAIVNNGAVILLRCSHLHLLLMHLKAVT